jgi:3-oxoacyl-[acyl-carrier protein] reductase
VDELTEAEWDRCVDVNLKGAFLVSRAALPQLRARGGGVIVNNASNAGLRPRPADPAYVASKAGLIALTQSMALAHAPDRIRVNAVCPGPVARTRITDRYLARNGAEATQILMDAAPLPAAYGRLIAPEEVAAAVLFLCSDEAEMITGAVLAVDGGKSAGNPGT